MPFVREGWSRAQLACAARQGLRAVRGERRDGRRWGGCSCGRVRKHSRDKRDIIARLARARALPISTLRPSPAQTLTHPPLRETMFALAGFSSLDLERVRALQEQFARERDWEQVRGAAPRSSNAPTQRRAAWVGILRPLRTRIGLSCQPVIVLRVQYHTPRNLLLALVGEVGELSEIFQWKGEVKSGLPNFTQKVCRQPREHTPAAGPCWQTLSKEHIMLTPHSLLGSLQLAPSTGHVSFRA